MVNFFTLFLQLLLLFNPIITTFQFGVKITMFYDKSLAMRLEQIASVDYQTISHAEIHNLQFFLRSKKLWKITKKLITEIHTAQQTLWQTAIIKRGEKRAESLFWFFDDLFLIIKMLFFGSEGTSYPRYIENKNPQKRVNRSRSSKWC